MEEQTQKNILYELYYDKKKGFQNLKSLIADTNNRFHRTLRFLLNKYMIKYHKYNGSM